MKVKFLILLLMTGIFLSGNSVFSPLGTPLQSYGNDVYGLGMGDTGISDLSRINCNQDNPSLLVSINKVTLSTAVNMGYYWYKSETESYRDDELYLPFFMLAVPIKDHRIGISLSTVYSGNLYICQNGLTSTAGGDSLVYDEIIRKTEDLYRTSCHYAFKNSYLNIGFSMVYYFGNHINYWSLDFKDKEFTDSKYEYEKTYSGVSYKLGVSKTIGKFSLGASYEPSAMLNGSLIYRYNFSPEEDTLQTDADLYEVPENIKGGVTYMFSNTLKLNLESNIIFWSQTEDRYEDSWRIAGGISYDPIAGYGRWYESIPFRLGASWSKLPFKSDGKEIDEMMLSAGSTIQLDSPGRKLDFAIRYLTRGNHEQSGYQDASLQLIIGVTGFDVFQKTPKRTADRDIPKVDPGMGVKEDTQ